MAAACGESRRCAISATVEWPSGPQATACAPNTQINAADKASFRMAPSHSQ